MQSSRKTVLVGALCVGLALAPAVSWSQPVPAREIPYAVDIQVSGDADGMDDAVEEASALVSEADTVPRTAGELLGRAAQDVTRAIAVLYARGYYGGTVTITVAGAPIDDPDAAEAAIDRAAATGRPVPVAITVAPGPQFVFGRVAVTGLPPGTPPFDRDALKLVAGEPARADAVLEAEETIVRQLQEQGYPLAAVAGREAVADHVAHTLDVTFRVVAGGTATLGPPVVEGAETVDAGLLARLATYEVGEPYHPDRLERYRDRLRKLQILSSVIVRPGEAIGPDGRVPVLVQVSENEPRVIGAGAFYSTDEGASVNAYWGHRNLFGNAEEFRVEGSVGRLGENALDDVDLKLATRFTKYGILTPADDLLLSATLLREHPDAFDREAFNADARIRRLINEDLTVEGGIEAEVSRVTDAFGTNEYLLVGLPLAATYDSTDDRLNPTEGVRASLGLEPLIDLENDGNLFGIVKASASTYRALDEAERFVVAGRIAFGSVVGAELMDVPADRRFYAGGGGSVRGYDFQSISPRAANGDILGGLSLVEASLELRYRLTEKIGVVPFIDAGRAYEDSIPDFGDGLKFGAGLGLRYLTPIGPIRVDVAFPLDRGPDDAGYGVYIGLGQAF